MSSCCNLLTLLKNASRVRKKFVFSPKNKFSSNLLKVLYKEGLISSFRVTPKNDLLKIQLKYSSSGKSCLNDVVFMSKPGNFLYLSYYDICKLSSGSGVFLISTKEGILTNQQCIRTKLGGTVICYIV